MEVTSFSFVAISIVSVFIYYKIEHRFRVAFLTLLSGLFLISFSCKLFLYLLIYSIVNYLFGKSIPNQRLKKILFISGIIFNLSQLIILKYASFTLSPFFGLLGIKYDLSLLTNYIIPVGISFFTLQSIGYLINIRMDWEVPEKRFLHFLLYITFFPRFISGPIDRSNHFLPQLDRYYNFDSQKITQSFRLILLGLFKKLVIANNLGLVVNGFYSDLNSIQEHSIWIIMFIQPLYLYYDFSGYTDIAMGIAGSFGLKLRPNFNKPFLSENMTEFWKRFHISLSSWFHDYVFVRIIFKTRKWGKGSIIIPLFVTWIIFGIWHGAGWTFMLLGVLQAIAIYYEYKTRRIREKLFSRFPSFQKRWMGRILTYMFYSLSLVFFFSPDLHSLGRIFANMFQSSLIWPDSMDNMSFILVMTFVLLLQIVEIISNDKIGGLHHIEVCIKRNTIMIRMLRWIFYLFVLILIVFLGNTGFEFIYFQF